MIELRARTAVVWSVLRNEVDRAQTAAPGIGLQVLDVGGGSGVFAVPLAQLGHMVTVIDPSPDALATLSRRAIAGGVADRIVAVQGDSDSVFDLVPRASADLVLCHSLLEVVDDVAATLAIVAAAARPGGCLSLLVANRAAAVLARAIGGHLAEAEVALADADGRWGPADGTPRRFDRESLVATLAAAGLVVEQLHGVRVVADLMPGALADGAGASLCHLELALSGLAPYRDIATQLHLLARVG